MQSLKPDAYKALKRVAKEYGVTIQELIRVRMVPEFLYGPIVIDKKTKRKILNGSSRKLRPKRNLS